MIWHKVASIVPVDITDHVSDKSRDPLLFEVDNLLRYSLGFNRVRRPASMTNANTVKVFMEPEQNLGILFLEHLFRDVSACKSLDKGLQPSPSTLDRLVVVFLSRQCVDRLCLGIV
jgi:hypothetical protein